MDLHKKSSQKKNLKLVASGVTSCFPTLNQNIAGYAVTLCDSKESATILERKE